MHLELRFISINIKNRYRLSWHLKKIIHLRQTFPDPIHYIWCKQAPPEEVMDWGSFILWYGRIKAKSNPSRRQNLTPPRFMCTLSLPSLEKNVRNYSKLRLQLWAIRRRTTLSLPLVDWTKRGHSYQNNVVPAVATKGVDVFFGSANWHHRIIFSQHCGYRWY